MSDHFDSQKDSPAVRAAQAAYIAALTAEIVPAMRLAARGCGYALCEHGSKARDIDLVAVAWTDGADDPDFMIDRLCGVVAGLTGRCSILLKPGDGDKNDRRFGQKPHGRRAYTLIHGGYTAEIDLSVVPPVKQPERVA